MDMPAPVTASFYDGQTARRHEVMVSALPDAVRLTLQGPDAAHRDIPLSLLRRAGDQPREGGQVVLQFLDPGADEMQREPSRLVLPKGVMLDWIAAHAPNLASRDVPKKTYLRMVKLVVFAGASLAALLLVIIPGLAVVLAGTVSKEREVAIGKSVVGQIEYLLAGFSDDDLTCETPAGKAALDRMIARLTDTGMISYQIDARVMRHKMVNAFAAPGGQVVILRGLLDAAESPDEVAGVLAHELGHVEARDPLREAFRSAGSAGILSMAMGDVTGGALTALLAEQMLSSAYTRDAEANADSFGLSLLEKAKISPQGLAVFFDRIAGMGGEMPEFLSSHPETVGRREKAAAAEGYAATPALSDADWQALKTICN